MSLTALIFSANMVSAKSSSDENTKVKGHKKELYESAPSGIDPASAKNMISSDGPKMTQAEFDHSKKIFFERCAGCHGVLRKGATGKALTTECNGQVYW